MSGSTASVICVIALLSCAAFTRAGESPCGPRLYITKDNADSAGGTLATMCAAEPWTAETDLATLRAGQRTVRVFDDAAYVVNRETGAIELFDVETAQPIRQFNLGAGVQPHDIAVIDAQTAYVTRHTHTHLMRLNLDTGDTEDVADLSIFADGNVPQMSMMVRDGNRVFVQIQHSSVLAVFDVTTETFVDVDPETPAVQPIELQGMLPKYKMQTDAAQRRLYVSAAGPIWSKATAQSPDKLGIEIIDLDALESIGFAITLADSQSFLSLGAFVMVSADRGYVLNHTEIVPSSHLVPFTITDGPEAKDIANSIGWVVTSLAFAPRTGQVYFPRLHATEPGIHVIDAASAEVLTDVPVSVGGRPTDIAVAQTCPADVNADALVNVDDLLFLLNAWGEAESFAPVDINQDGVVNVDDLLAVLNNWGACQ